MKTLLLAPNWIFSKELKMTKKIVAKVEASETVFYEFWFEIPVEDGDTDWDIYMKMEERLDEGGADIDWDGNIIDGENFNIDDKTIMYDSVEDAPEWIQHRIIKEN
jgi:hypothetical protein